MDTIHTHLLPLELYILKLLAKGLTNEQILLDHGIMKREVNLPYLHQICMSIRKKTGIHNTKDAQDCRQWLKRHPTGRILPRRESELNLAPTPTQQRIMLMFIRGVKIAEIARILGMGKQTALNHLSIGCRRAGVKGTGPYHLRIDSILEWFDAKEDGMPVEEPASTNVADY